jgi:hypothetical protein
MATMVSWDLHPTLKVTPNTSRDTTIFQGHAQSHEIIQAW